MAAHASASTRPLSLPLTVPLSGYHSHVLPAPSSSRLLPRRRVALAPARPGAALLSSLSDAPEQEQEQEEEEDGFYEDDEQQEYDDKEEEEEQGYDEEEDGELVEVGYVSGAHGVRGDVLVTPRTDFPELRLSTVAPTLIGYGRSLSLVTPVPSATDWLTFLVCLFWQPGTRWLRARAAGKQQVREFELVRGRAHTGKKSWIVSFDGIDNLDEVRLLCTPHEII